MTWIRGVQRDDDFFLLRSDEIDANVICRQWQSPAAAVYEHGKLHFRRPTMVKKLIECSLHRAARKQHIVDEDYVRPMDIPGNLGGREFFWNRMPADVVAMKRNIERSSTRGDAGLACRQARAQTTRELNPAVRNSEQEERTTVPVTLSNGINEPLDRSPYLACADRLMFAHEARLWR